jgi:hypothetical protein
MTIQNSYNHLQQQKHTQRTETTVKHNTQENNSNTQQQE